jgi:8-oxo-dGTP diphosphatase
MKKVDKLFVAMKAFILYEGKVLLLQESDAYADGTNAGKWEMPGGRMEPDESFKNAIVREVKEETGRGVEVGRPFMLGEWWPNVRGEQWHIVATFSICHAKSANVTLGPDHGTYVWLDPKEYTKYNNDAAYIKESIESYLELENK